MCRTYPHPRRCPGDGGARRRARQNAAYARKKQARLDAQLAALLADPRVSMNAPVTGDPMSPVYAAVADCAEQFRSGDAAAYTAAVQKLGGLVGADADERTSLRFVEKGIDETSVIRWQKEMIAEHERIQAATKVIGDEQIALTGPLLQTPKEFEESGRKTLTPAEKARSTELAEKADALYAERIALMRACSSRVKEIDKQRIAIRRECYIESLTAAGARFDSADVPQSISKMTKKDQTMMREMLGTFPSHLIDHTEAVSGVCAWKRSKARAHYSGAKRSKKQLMISHVPAIRRDAEGNLRVDTSETRYVAVTDPERIRQPSNTWYDDTPENRERLEHAMAQCNSASNTWELQHYGPLVMDSYTPPGEDEPKLILRHTKQTRRMVNGAITAELTYSTGSVMAHEYGHRVEAANPEISRACKEFLHRRTAGLKKERYHRKEWVIPDGFADRYIGKDYENSPHTEVFSMGMEALMYGDSGGLVGQNPVQDPMYMRDDVIPVGEKPDFEHRDLMLGMLAAGKIAQSPINQTT